MSYGKAESYRCVPRDFNSLIQTCSSNIQRITQNTAQIKSMVSQLGTKQDTSELQDNLQQMQHDTNQLAKETNKYLKEFGSVPLPLSLSEQRQQKIQRDRLMNDFSAVLNNFQAVQRRAAEKEKESVARARAGSRLSAEDSSWDEKLVSFDNQEDWGQVSTQADEMAITEEDLDLIKDRETNIRQLESDIMDVNQIFKDLAVMIHDQGEMIASRQMWNMLKFMWNEERSNSIELPSTSKNHGRRCASSSWLGPLCSSFLGSLSGKFQNESTMHI
ncbi:syntaxin-12 isoform X1 [Brachionichthys hirsutus]|uniref:syntaxin-12 isoform X1 n=1 Tax=Brachionichthys hirsutus TaxID=412623 RepID=UPI003604F4D3